MNSPATPGAYRLTLPDVVRFMGAKGVPTACPVCQYPTAITGFGPSEATAALTYSEHPLSGQGFMPLLPPGYAKPVISLECYNCGHIRLFSYHVVSQWAVANPSSNSLLEVLYGDGNG